MFDGNKLGSINFIDNETEIVRCLEFLGQVKEKLWLWQEKKGEPRQIHFGIVKRVVLEKRVVMLFSGRTGVHFGFDRTGPVYVYSQGKRVAFQAEYKNVENEFINLDIPLKIGVLTPEQCEKLAVVEIENESAHRHKRVHDRKHPEGGKSIRLEKVQDGKTMSFGTYDLYDMSQGGMSFLIRDPSLFQNGERVRFTHIDEEPLGKKLNGEVMSVRWFGREDGDTILKVGVKFYDA